MRTLLLLALMPLGFAQEPKALFLANCAPCHGERGDGHGTTELPKPARSFLDGGFSYGNTRRAIGRTIEHGIPGTPMPSFGETLTSKERAALVEYVISLGPPRKEVASAETLLLVEDHPRVARGLLPSLAPGAPQWPRGLLIGLTSGTTFEYRSDDVRLLAVRQGEFVERRDWSGRGGAPLAPLGKVTLLVEGGNPAPVWSSDGGSLHARLTATRIRGEGVVLGYRLESGEEVLARVEETPRVVQAEGMSGFVREFQVTSSCAAPLSLELRWDVRDASAGRERLTFEPEGEPERTALAFEHPLGDLPGMTVLTAPSRALDGAGPDKAGRTRFTVMPGSSLILRLYELSWFGESALPTTTIR